MKMSNWYKYNHMTLFIVPMDNLDDVTDHKSE